MAFDTDEELLAPHTAGAEHEQADAGAYSADVDRKQIHILPQTREEFEDSEQTLADLGASLKECWTQPVLLRPRAEGGYWLVAGERRIQAAELVGIAKIPSRICPKMNEAQADLAQQAENIHRKNLTQVEQAKKVKRDLDGLGGDKAALMERWKKSAAWLSKTLSLLDLGPQAKRLMTENLSDDKDLIHSVRQIEQRNPKAAKETVDRLKARTGERPRDVVNKAKDAVKPPTKAKQERAARANAGGSVATPKDTTHEQPGPGRVNVFGAFKKAVEADADAEQHQEPGAEHSKMTPLQTLEDLSDVERSKLEGKLNVNFLEGKNSVNAGRDLIVGLRDGTFGTQGNACFRLAAFMQGLALVSEFDMEACLETVKP